MDLGLGVSGPKVISLRLPFPICKITARTAGLEQLVRIDRRYAAFQGTLFADNSVGLDRDQLTPAEDADLDRSIEAFLAVLSCHFLHPNAFRALEYMLRKYRQDIQPSMSLLHASLRALHLPK